MRISLSSATISETSALSATKGALQDKVATELLKSWIPTEASRKVTMAKATFKCKDVLKAQTMLNKDDIPQEGRTCLLDALAYEQLLED